MFPVQRARHALLALLCAVSLVFAAALPSPARADTLDAINQRGALRWGADQEGGGPYVFPEEERPEVVTGFEVDIAAKIAEYMKVRSEFQQGQWDKMPDLLKAEKVDLILNGFELLPERLDVMDASIPYYVYALQLLARKGDSNFDTWDKLRENRGKVGVLTGSAAEEQMLEFCGDLCTVIPYDGNTDAMREVETGKLDATLQDTPIASFYAPRFPGLVPIGEPVGEGHYVAYVRKDDARLLKAVNEALILMMRNGDLKAINRRYGIDDDKQAKLLEIIEQGRFFGYHAATSAEVTENELPDQEVVRTESRKRGWAVVQSYGGILVESAGITVILSVLSFPLAILIGLLVAVGRLYGPAWLRLPLTAYVEFIRGTPVMLQLYFVFFLLPELGITIPAFWCGVIGLAINYSAYEAEIYRAGLQAIPVGQMEAALSLGLSRPQAIRRVIVPQAVRIVIPPVVNDFIALFKDTSVCSVVTIVELTKRFSVLSMSTQATVELMALTALLYLAMSYPMSLVARRVEKNLGNGGVTV